MFLMPSLVGLQVTFVFLFMLLRFFPIFLKWACITFVIRRKKKLNKYHFLKIKKANLAIRPSAQDTHKLCWLVLSVSYGRSATQLCEDSLSESLTWGLAQRNLGCKTIWVSPCQDACSYSSPQNQTPVLISHTRPIPPEQSPYPTQSTASWRADSCARWLLGSYAVACGDCQQHGPFRGFLGISRRRLPAGYDTLALVWICTGWHLGSALLHFHQ